MANLLQKTIQRSSFPSMSMDDYAQFFSFNGLSYPFGFSQTMGGNKEEVSDFSFEGLAISAYKTNGIVFACMLARQLPFSEARFKWRRIVDGRPGEYFGSDSLSLLERPWPGGVTADLLSRAIQDVDLSGNFFATRRPKRIRRLRPDWVTIILGSHEDPNIQAGDIDAEVVGYMYHPGGRLSSRPPTMLLREEVAHWAPIPDPTASFRGMSWLIPIIREFSADSAMITHKNKFFENGATPNMVVTLDPSIKKEAFKEWVQMFSEKHEGALNAYKTLYLGAGSTVMPVGKDFKQMDFAITQAAGESRIAAAAGVPAMLVGLSEGMKSATYANYGQARRRFADMTIRPNWRGFANSMEILIPKPTGGPAELWYDDRDIPFLIEDVQDRAEVQAKQTQSIRQLIDVGFTPESVIDAVDSQDFRRLKHTGLFSVQLWTPGEHKEGEKSGDGEGGSHPGGTDPGHPKKKTENEAPPPEKKSAELSALEDRERSARLLMEAALEIARLRGDPAPVPQIERGDVHVHMAEGMVRSDVHVDANTTVEPGAIRSDAPQVHVDANTTIEAGAVQVEAPTTIAEGAIRSDVHVDPTELVIQDGAIRSVTEIREGALQVSAPITVEGHQLELRDGAIHVVTEIQEGAVQVDAPVTIERGAVEIDAPVTVERTEVHVDEGAVKIDSPITVERTEVKVDAPITVERSDVEVHVDEGAVQVSAPVTVERQDVQVHVDEGAVQVEVAPAELRMEPGSVQVDISAPVTVEPAQVTIEDGAIRVDSPVTIEEGAIRMDAPITVETPEVRMEPHIDVTTPDVHVTIEEGAVRVEPAQVTVERTEVNIEAPVTIEDGAVQVAAPEVRFEEGAISVDSPVTIEEGAVRIDAPTTIEAPEIPKRNADKPVKKTVKRDEVTGQILEVIETTEDSTVRKVVKRDAAGRVIEVAEETD